MIGYYLYAIVAGILWVFGSFLPTMAYTTKNGKETFRSMNTFSSLAYAFWMTIAMPAAVGCFYRWEQGLFFQVIGTFLLADFLFSRTTRHLLWHALKQFFVASFNVGCIFGKYLARKVDGILETVLSWYSPEEEKLGSR